MSTWLIGVLVALAGALGVLVRRLKPRRPPPAPLPGVNEAARKAGVIELQKRSEASQRALNRAIKNPAPTRRDFEAEMAELDALDAELKAERDRDP